jgi:hypothetical protein
MKWSLACLSALVASQLAAGSALADKCPPQIDPSASSEEKSGINFFNATPNPMRIYWVNFESKLEDWGPLDPGDMVELETFTGHRWMVEMQAPGGTYCMGPLWPPAKDICQVRLEFGTTLTAKTDFCEPLAG